MVNSLVLLYVGTLALQSLLVSKSNTDENVIDIVSNSFPAWGLFVLGSVRSFLTSPSFVWRVPLFSDFHDCCPLWIRPRMM